LQPSRSNIALPVALSIAHESVSNSEALRRRRGLLVGLAQGRRVVGVAGLSSASTDSARGCGPISVGAATARTAGEENAMRRLVRFMSTASMVTLGLVAAPVLARPDTPQTADSLEGKTADPVHGGGMLIEKALDEVQLRPEQKAAVEKLKAEAVRRHAPAKAWKQQFAMQLADQIEKGKIDRCALAPTTKTLAWMSAEARPGDRAAFERLHSILDPGQRAEFVDALKRQWEAHEKMHEPAALAEKMANELYLTPDQKASVGKILDGIHEIREAQPSSAAHRERWAKILDAFKSDHFVLDEVAPLGDVAAHTAAKVERMLWAGEAILPVLKPEQRKALADKLREHVREHVREAAPATGMSPSEEE
jgi:Spy/CpxP family protein refolding chaperone